MKFIKKNLFIMFVMAIIFYSGIQLAASIQETETPKHYTEIAGSYEFEIEGNTLLLIFFTEDGLLYGTQEGQNEDVELEPVEGKPLEFEATAPGGQFFELKFIRNENGKITKCTLNTEGMEVVGERVDEK